MGQPFTLSLHGMGFKHASFYILRGAYAVAARCLGRIIDRLTQRSKSLWAKFMALRVSWPWDEMAFEGRWRETEKWSSWLIAVGCGEEGKVFGVTWRLLQNLCRAASKPHSGADQCCQIILLRTLYFSVSFCVYKDGSSRAKTKYKNKSSRCSNRKKQTVTDNYYKKHNNNLRFYQ